MRKTLVLFLTAGVFGLGGGQMGCEQQPSQNTAIQAASAKLEKANKGFVPATGKKQKTPDLRAYHQKMLQQAGAKLDQAIQAGGNSGVQVAARRLRAEIDRSAARFASLQAARKYADLAPQSDELLSYVVAAGQAAARGQALVNHKPKLSTKLRQQIQEQNARQEKLQKQAKRLNRKLQAQQAQLQKLQKKHDAATAKAQKFRSQAFTANGNKHYELLTKAARAKALGDKAVTAAQRRQITIDLLQSQRRVVGGQLKLVNTLISQLKQRRKAAAAREGAVREGRGEAQKSRDTLMQNMGGKFKQVLSGYRSSVDQPLDTADRRMSQAVDHLQHALQKAGAGKQQALKRDLLSARMSQARMLTEHFNVTDDFAQSVSLLAQGGKRLTPQQSKPLQRALEQLQKSRQVLAQKAKQAIRAGQDLAKELGDAGGDVAKIAQAQQKRLAAYLKTLNQSAQSRPKPRQQQTSQQEPQA